MTRRCAVSAVIVLVSATVVACTSPSDSPPEPTSTLAPPSSTPDAGPTPEAEPQLVPAGSAEDNLPYFDLVNSALLGDGSPGGRPIIDSLVAAGFDKTAMQVTADRTPQGSAVDSLQFSVQIGEHCLIGQADGSGYASTVAPALESGGCLLGKTRAIDW